MKYHDSASYLRQHIPQFLDLLQEFSVRSASVARPGDQGIPLAADGVFPGIVIGRRLPLPLSEILNQIIFHFLLQQ